MSLKHTSLAVKINNKPIDYFKLKEDYFTPHSNSVIKNIISLKPDEYLEYPKHFLKFNLEEKETVVFNFQVGKGKTTLCYELIKEYVNKGYYVIVASPFIKLVDKDYQEIENLINPTIISGIVTGKPKRVANYSELNTNGYYDYQNLPVLCDVHIMTINCLLGNPGDNAIEQNFYKKEYLKKLLDETKDKKVVLFIDEIHESVHNFKASLIPNLLKWNGRIEKVFIASATFTPSTIPVIQSISFLTDRNIKIFEADRIKINKQARINVHLCNFPYSTKEFEFINLIEKQIINYRNKGKEVNIITGSKAFAEKISDECFETIIDSSKKIKKNISINQVNMLTGETDVVFQSNQNNIGTTFKTGVNIIDKDGVLFIIFPTITNEPRYNNYGIFTDGIPSIIQSLGRLRNGGEIHLFLNEPEIIIGDILDYSQKLSSINNLPFLPINNAYDEVANIYKKEITSIGSEIMTIETDLEVSRSNNPLLTTKGKFGFWYPNIHEYLMERSQRLMLNSENPSFGRLLSPYILWACLNDQFINATLVDHINYYTKDSITIDINPSNSEAKFRSILQGKNVKSIPYKQAIQNIDELFGQQLNNDGKAIKVKFKPRKREVDKSYTIAQLINKNPTYIKSAFEVLSREYCEESISFGKKEYFKRQIEKVKKKGNKELSNYEKTYEAFGIIENEFINWINSSIVEVNGIKYLSTDLDFSLPDEIAQKVCKLVLLLRENDSLVKQKGISFLQNLDIEKPLNQKKKIYKALEEVFLDVSKERKKIGKKNYYKIS